jgi:hypothetical protein
LALPCRARFQGFYLEILMADDLFERYEVPEEHKQLLNVALGRPQFSEDLPAEVRRCYIIYRQWADRLNHTISNLDLLNILSMCADTSNEPLKPATPVPKMWKDGRLKRDDLVLCEWRGDKDTPAVLLDVNASGEPVVRIVGDSEERPMAADRVRPAPDGYHVGAPAEAPKRRGRPPKKKTIEAG